MTQTSQHTSQSIAYLGAHQSLPLLANVALHVAVTLTKWRLRQISRKHLGRLEGHMLDDIGLSPTQVQRESKLWFWQS